MPDLQTNPAPNHPSSKPRQQVNIFLMDYPQYATFAVKCMQKNINAADLGLGENNKILFSHFFATLSVIASYVNTWDYTAGDAFRNIRSHGHFTIAAKSIKMIASQPFPVTISARQVCGYNCVQSLVCIFSVRYSQNSLVFGLNQDVTCVTVLTGRPQTKVG